MNMLISLMERGVLPDAVIRIGIRLLHRRRLQQEHLRRVSGSHYQQTCEDWLRIMPILEKRSRCETATNSSNGKRRGEKA